MESTVVDRRIDLVLEQVREAWRFALEKRDVGFDDEWSSVGGTSLDALDVAWRIKEIFGGSFPLSLFAEAPTVRHQAQWLVETVEGQPWNTIVRFRQGSTEQPFFCIHPIGGNVLCYLDLAAAMHTGQEFYGVQARGLDGVEQPLRTFDEMADHYVAAIREVQHKGPYHLGGWSAGGALVFEVAHRLRARGDEVALLALIDALYPDRSGNRHETPQEELLEFERLILDEPDAVPDHYVEDRTVREIYTEQWHQYSPQPYDGKVTMFLAHSQLFRMRDALASLRQEMKKGPFGKSRRALRTAERLDRMSPLRWHEVARGGFEVVTVRGDHQSLIRGDGAEVIARALCERMA